MNRPEMPIVQAPSSEEMVAAFQAGIKEAFYEYLTDAGFDPKMPAVVEPPAVVQLPTGGNGHEPGYTGVLRPKRTGADVPAACTRWTAEDEDLLRVAYPGLAKHPEALERLMGRTDKACEERARRLGLKAED